MKGLIQNTLSYRLGSFPAYHLATPAYAGYDTAVPMYVSRPSYPEPSPVRNIPATSVGESGEKHVDSIVG